MLLLTKVTSPLFISLPPLEEKDTIIIIIIIIIIITIILLFTLGSIYSTNASGAEQMPETNNSNQTKQG